MIRHALVVLLLLMASAWAADDTPPSINFHMTNACGNADDHPIAAVVVFTNIAQVPGSPPATSYHATNVGGPDAFPAVAAAHISNLTGGADDFLPVTYVHAVNPPSCGGGAAPAILTQTGSDLLIASGSKLLEGTGIPPSPVLLTQSGSFFLVATGSRLLVQ